MTLDRRARLYLDLLKRCLTGHLFIDAEGADPHARAEGRDFPATAETMIGFRRLDNIQHCVATVVGERVPGDLIEAGVWRGGATIFMRAVLEALGDGTRTVWAADSFAGLPRPDVGRYPADAGLEGLCDFDVLSVPLEDVKANFARYGLLDDRVRFLPGWFKDTLPTAPIERLAVCRLDGDLYESTHTALEALYPRVSPGGFLIVDDYNDIAACRAAVDDYRSTYRVTEPMTEVDWTAVYWRKALR